MHALTSLPIRTLLLSSLALVAAAQGEGREPVPDMVAPAGVELAQPIVRVPITVQGSRPIPQVEAMVNGEGPFRFFLDTGASVCVFDTAFVERLGIESTGKTGVGDPSQSERIQADEVLIGEIYLGGASFTGVPGVAFDRRSFGAAEGVVGVLGMPLFLDHLFTLDYARGEIVVQSGALDPDGAHVARVELNPLPEFRLDVNGTPLVTHLDSGSPSSFMLPTSFLQGQELREPLTLLGRARTVNSEFEIYGARLAGTITLLGHVFEDPEVRSHDLFPYGNVGYEILRDFALTLDLKNRLLRLERVEAAAREAGVVREREDLAGRGGRRRMGAQLAGGPDGVHVRMVVPGSEAERAGLLAGDRLVSVDGSEPGSGDVLALLGEALKGTDPIGLVLERGGEEARIVLFPGDE